MTRTITVKEWKQIAIGGDGIAEKDAQRVHALAERMTRRLKVPQPVLERTAKPGLKAGQVVGVLVTPNVNIEILPKIDAKNNKGNKGNKGNKDGKNDAALRKSLMRMLAVVRNLPVADQELARFGVQHQDLLEILIRIFTDRLLEAARRGLPHRYLHFADDLPRLRGKLHIQRQFSRNAVRPDRLACLFDEFSADTPLNRLLKAAIVRLLAVSKSANTLRKLGELHARFDNVSDSPAPLCEPVKLDRTNRSYHKLHTLARLILARDWQNTTTGRSEGFGLLFPMNDLFEEFIGRSMQIALPDCDVHLQHKVHHVIASPNPRFQLRPDIVIKQGRDRLVMDTKWKRLQPDPDKNFDVKQADIYQLLAYAKAYDAKRVILLYPWHRKLGQRRAGIYQRWYTAGNSVKFDIATVDVSLSAKKVRCTLEEIYRDSASRYSVSA